MPPMLIHSDELFEVAQIRKIEAYASEELIQDEPTLMLNAAQAAEEVFFANWPEAQSVAIFCGKGNNGGDGVVLAQLLKKQNIDVTLYAVEPTEKMLGLDIPLINLQEEAIYAHHVEADVIIDALLGIGLQGEVSEEYTHLIELINQLEKPVLAIDLPTGIDADSGSLHGIAVKADVTVTFIGLKQGMFTRKGLDYCGKVILSDLNLPAEIYRQVSPTAQLITWKAIRHHLPKRNRDSNKGNFGHVLVIGGDYGMGGAVRMAAEAAYRVGAGLVSVATRPEHATIVSAPRPEIMCHSVEQAEDLDALIAGCSVIVIGPGLGKSDWSKALYGRVLKSKKPKVVDADALNLLAQQPQRADNWILTPHPGEAGRLLSATSLEVQQDRFKSATELQQCYGGVAVLKGAGTIVKSDDPVPGVCRAGNPGMATGGMGDVLTGVIGGLLAQGLDVFSAAEVGVFVHATAGDRAAAEQGERGMLASDLLLHLHNIVNPE